MSTPHPTPNPILVDSNNYAYMDDDTNVAAWFTAWRSEFFPSYDLFPKERTPNNQWSFRYFYVAFSLFILFLCSFSWFLLHVFPHILHTY